MVVIMSGARAAQRPPNTQLTTAFAVGALSLVVGLASVGVASAAPQDGSVDGLKAKYIDVMGVQTRYYDYGQGEPVVLVHGEGFSGHSSANSWAKNIPGLAKRFRVVAADKLASGLTGNPADDKDYNLEGEVEHMYQFIKTMKLGKVHLVGQSRGGILVLFLASLHPDVVKTLIIVNSANASPDVGTTGRAASLATCPASAGDAAADYAEWKCRMRAMSFLPFVAFDETFFESGRYMANLPKARTTLAKIAAGAGEPLSKQLPKTKAALHERIRNEGLLQMPVLIYWGIDDPNNVPGFPPAKTGLALYDLISAKNPRVRMQIISRAGHFHFREYPDEFNYNIGNFIEYWNAHPAATPATGYK
ncbi:MAG: alpha/beta hydrolase [Acidobacteriota bacterium]